MKKYSLSKDERIKSKLIIGELFSVNKFFISGDKTVKLLYLLVPKTGQNMLLNGDEEGNYKRGEIKFAVTVSKRVGNAVWRNRIKRLIKESYRLLKPELYDLLDLRRSDLYLIISPFHINQKKFKRLSLDHVKDGIREVLFRAVKELNSRNKVRHEL